MKPIIIFLLLSLGRFDAPLFENPEIVYDSPTLKIKQLDVGVYMHISYLQTNDYGKVACNGMIYANNGEAIVFDTPTNDDTSKELIDWIQNNQKLKVIGIVVTHFHNDCLGGLNIFHLNDIKSYANDATIILAKADKVKTLPQQGFENSIELKAGGENVVVKFFGEGHTKDNVVGYVPSRRTLFGGCLIKTLNATKGYLGDANTGAWSSTVELIKAQFPEIKTVVPGHGKPGGTELLDYTIQLFDGN